MTFILDDIDAVVAAMRPIDISYGQPLLDYIEARQQTANLSLMPYYHYGHPLEIANELIAKDRDRVTKHQKYPMVALRMDTPEPPISGLVKYNLNILICTITDVTWTTRQRIEYNFRPVLKPLYERFLLELGRVGLFTFTGNDKRVPLHTPILHPFWGEAEKQGNVKYIFNDPIDCIELVDLELNRTKNCP
jgi:hypothetical protein